MLHVYVVGRSVVDFLLVIIEHFSYHSQLRNCEVAFLSHPFGDLGGKVGALSISRWKARDRLPISDK